MLHKNGDLAVGCSDGGGLSEPTPGGSSEKDSMVIQSPPGGLALMNTESPFLLTVTSIVSNIELGDFDAFYLEKKYKADVGRKA